MSRLDIVSLRKTEGLSQRKLAEMLEMKPSFLSAIENGRSRLPEDKLDRLKAIFGEPSIVRFLTPEHAPETHIPPHTHLHDEGDSLTQLLNHFHDLAHQRSASTDNNLRGLSDRLNLLSDRNDRLSARLDDLRDEVDSLRAENLRLKELLIKNGIPYSD